MQLKLISNEKSKGNKFILFQTQIFIYNHRMCHNHGTCHSKGVMILLNPKLDCQIDEEVQDKNGRFLGAGITLDDVQIV